MDLIGSCWVFFYSCLVVLCAADSPPLCALARRCTLGAAVEKACIDEPSNKLKCEGSRVEPGPTAIGVCCGVTHACLTTCLLSAPLVRRYAPRCRHGEASQFQLLWDRAGCRLHRSRVLSGAIYSSCAGQGTVPDPGLKGCWGAEQEPKRSKLVKPKKILKTLIKLISGTI